MEQFNNRADAIRWLAYLGAYKKPLYERFKLWAFATSYKLLVRNQVPHLLAFITALAQTADGIGDISTLPLRELSGFRVWVRNCRNAGRRKVDSEDVLDEIELEQISAGYHKNRKDQNHVRDMPSMAGGPEPKNIGVY